MATSKTATYQTSTRMTPAATWQTQKPASPTIADTQAVLDETVSIMRKNIDIVLVRDAKLGDLEDASENLRAGAQRFEKTAGKLKTKMWWKNAKYMVMAGMVVLILIGVVVAIAML